MPTGAMSAIAGFICCVRAVCSLAHAMTRWCSSWWTRDASARSRSPRIPSATGCCKPSAASGPLTQRQLVHGFIANPLGQAIPDLMALAEMRAGEECDNLSVVALAWAEDEVAADAPQTVPQAVAQRERATDVQDFTATDLDFLHVSDEDIEKATAEIKAALRKNAPR